MRSEFANERAVSPTVLVCFLKLTNHMHVLTEFITDTHESFVFINITSCL